MAKRSYTIIAEHFSLDGQSVRDYEYQPGRYRTPIYALTDDEYWAAGNRKPHDPDGLLTNWQKVISVYDQKSVLWVCKVTQ